MISLNKTLPRPLIFAILGLGSGLIAWILAVYTPLHTVNRVFEARTYDLRARINFANDHDVKIEDVVVIDIDTRAIANLGRFQQWSRNYYIRLLDVLAEEEVKAVAFDILFDPYRDPFADSTFAAAISRNQRVAMALDFAPEDTANFLYAMNQPPEGLNVEGRTVNFSGDPVCSWQRERLEVGVPGLNNRSWLLGFVNAQHDIDGIIRRAPLLMNFAGEYYPSLAFVLASQIKGWDLNKVEGDANQVKVFNDDGEFIQSIQLDGHGRMLLNFRGPFQSFRYISLYDVIEKRLPPGYFKDKVVFIGASYAGLADLKAVPVQSVYAGVEIHATAFHNLINNDPMRLVPSGITFLSVLAFAMIAAVAIERLKVSRIIILLSLVVTGYLAASLLVFSYANYSMAIIIPFGGLAFSGIVASTYKYMVEEKDKRFLRTAFTHYVSKEVVAELVEDPEKLSLGGQRRQCTLMFSDIRSFTSISEQLSAEDLGTMLNRYLTEMTNIVFDYGGTLDKYIGDAVVTIYGAPLPHEDHAMRAIHSAIKMQEAILELRKEFEGTPFGTIAAGIGLHTGSVIVGNFGSNVRFDYTAIGDSMNLASRLEGLTKYYRCNILCSSDTMKQMDNTIVTRHLDEVIVKGRVEPVGLYEVLGYAEKIDLPEDFFEEYETAMQFYLAGGFEAAHTHFSEFLINYPDDGPASMMVERLQELILNPPDRWQGAWNMTVK